MKQAKEEPLAVTTFAAAAARWPRVRARGVHLLAQGREDPIGLKSTAGKRLEVQRLLVDVDFPFESDGGEGSEGSTRIACELRLDHKQGAAGSGRGQPFLACLSVTRRSPVDILAMSLRSDAKPYIQ